MCLVNKHNKKRTKFPTFGRKNALADTQIRLHTDRLHKIAGKPDKSDLRKG